MQPQPTKRGPSANPSPASNGQDTELPGGAKQRGNVTYFPNASGFKIRGGVFTAAGGILIPITTVILVFLSPVEATEATQTATTKILVYTSMSPNSVPDAFAEDQVSPLQEFAPESNNEAIEGKILHSDLPGTAQNDAGQLVESVIRKVALSTEPFKRLRKAETQKLIDKMYGCNKYSMDGHDIWTGLLNQKIDIWRNNFGSEGLKSAQEFLATDSKTSSAQKIREHVDDALQELDDGMEHYAWKDEGFGMQEMILCKFKRAHLDKVNGGTDSMDDVPFATILLSFVAVQRALEWKKSNSTSEFDSFPSWAPIGVINSIRIERFKYSVYCETLETCVDDDPTWWKEFLQAAKKVDRKRKPQKVVAKQPALSGEKRELMLVD
ncbi:hypothetical protein BT96DRAFT_1005894 [Gymnopus androsaceus JB14]|uniref:Uncharacterized protein n=1 Tax=Gymnopus androsaceus JB14 TaxID=1447944 RepID=A0A6A4GME0_9AGAR|nr:hypothetical protein BT96DRAFT_1005894 [Gymnopus androsaceus JB14]